MTYEELKEGLLELNDMLEFDDAAFYQYHDAAIGTRAAISMAGEHICNVDTGDIPEERVTAPARAPQIIHPDERDYETTHTKKIVAFEDNPLFFEADQQMGKQQIDLIMIGATYPAMGERAYATDWRTNPPQRKDVIIIRMYFELKYQDDAVIKIGWKDVMKRLITAEVVTQEELEETFDVVSN
jgi:hypothetical protein